MLQLRLAAGRMFDFDLVLAPRLLAFLPQSKYRLGRLTGNSNPGPCTVLQLPGERDTFQQCLSSCWILSVKGFIKARYNTTSDHQRQTATHEKSYCSELVDTDLLIVSVWVMVALLTRVTTLIPIQLFNSNKYNSSAACDLL